MNPWGLGVIAILAGLLLGIVLARLLWHRPSPEVTEPEAFEEVDPVVPWGVSEVLAVLSLAAVVVGPHDQVLRSSEPARTLSLVRGSRVALGDLLDLVRAVRADGRTQTTDLEVHRGPGTPAIYLYVRVVPLGQDLILILAEDRTTARRIEETRRDFLANVSHELKTPIGAISLLAEAVEEAAEDPEAVRRFASRMSTESQRLTELVRQIIDLSRLQADNPLMNAEEVDVDEVIAVAVDGSRVDAERKQVLLTIAGESHSTVLGDERQLINAVGNLVQNAVIYSDPGARVAVAARQVRDNDDELVEITVSDNGIGIAPDDLARIFERFYRVDYARSRDNGGTGLGLSIVKHIAASHRGEVTVWSQLGSGSTFTIRLPACQSSRETDAVANDHDHIVVDHDQLSRQEIES